MAQKLLLRTRESTTQAKAAADYPIATGKKGVSDSSMP